MVSWDTASTLSETSDWSVGAVWGALGLDFYLLDVYRARLEAPELRRAIIQLHERHNASATLIEDTELGRALAQDLYRTGHLRAIAQRPERDKLARLLAQAARFEAGQVHLPEIGAVARDLFERAPWLPKFDARRPSGRDIAGPQLADRSNAARSAAHPQRSASTRYCGPRPRRMILAFLSAFAA